MYNFELDLLIVNTVYGLININICMLNDSYVKPYSGVNKQFYNARNFDSTSSMMIFTLKSRGFISRTLCIRFTGTTSTYTRNWSVVRPQGVIYRPFDPDLIFLIGQIRVKPGISFTNVLGYVGTMYVHRHDYL